MKSVLKSMLFMPQTVIENPLRAPTLAISHFDMTDFKPENWEKISKALTTSLIEFSFSKKTEKVSMF